MKGKTAEDVAAGEVIEWLKKGTIYRAPTGKTRQRKIASERKYRGELFVTQSFHWIDGGSAAGGNETRENRSDDQY